MSVKINLGKWGSVFAVPTCLIDEHIKLASPLQLKIILFLLRNSDKNFTVEEIGEHLSAHCEDVTDAIEFWVQREIICKNDNELKPMEGSVLNKIEEEPQEEEKPKVRRSVTRIAKPSLIDSAQRVASDESLQHLLAEVEGALSKPLTGGDVSVIVMLYDTYGLPAEVIAMLVHYCISIEKGNFATIQKIGVEWSDSGINTLEKAENRIQQVNENNDNWNAVKYAFGLKNAGSPSKKQLEFAQQWVGQWHFSHEMLRAAYELCIDNTGNLSMPYIHKILKKWHDSEIFKPEDIEKLDSKKTAKKSTNKKASYDIEELENNHDII